MSNISSLILVFIISLYLNIKKKKFTGILYTIQIFCEIRSIKLKKFKLNSFIYKKIILMVLKINNNIKITKQIKNTFKDHWIYIL